MKKIKFKGEVLTLNVLKYNNGTPALQLVDEDGAPYMVASVNLPDANLKKGEVAIKNWSENRGILDTLIKNRIVSKPVRTVKSGFVDVPIVKLLIK